MSQRSILFLVIGVLMGFLGLVQWLALFGLAAGGDSPLAPFIENNPQAHYLAATGGCAFLAWSTALFFASKKTNPAFGVVALASSVGLLTMSVMRLFTALSGLPGFEALQPMLYIETVLFLGLAVWFFTIARGASKSQY